MDRAGRYVRRQRMILSAMSCGGAASESGLQDAVCRTSEEERKFLPRVHVDYPTNRLSYLCRFKILLLGRTTSPHCFSSIPRQNA